jgi:hypothetical protein
VVAVTRKLNFCVGQGGLDGSCDAIGRDHGCCSKE